MSQTSNCLYTRAFGEWGQFSLRGNDKTTQLPFEQGQSPDNGLHDCQAAPVRIDQQALDESYRPGLLSAVGRSGTACQRTKPCHATQHAVARHTAAISFCLFILASAAWAHVPSLAPAFMPADLPGVPARSSPTAFFQDRHGLLWFGTEDGLVRYDGYETRLYTHDPDNDRSLSNNSIYSIIEDRQGHIWVGTRNGLNRLDQENAEFDRYLVEATISFTLSDAFVNHLWLDGRNQLWVGTGLSIKRYDPEQDSFISHTPWHPEFAPPSGPGILTTLVSEDDQFWIGTYAGGLVRFNPETKSFRQYSAHSANRHKLNSNRVRAIARLDAQRLLLGTLQGLVIFDTVEESYEPLPTDEIVGKVFAIEVDAKGDYWLSTIRGLFRLSAEFDQVVRYGADQGLDITPDEPVTEALFIDREQNIWLGIRNNGIHTLSALSNRIKRVQLQPQDYLANQVQITALMQHGSSLWLGTHDGIHIIDAETSHSRHINLDEGLNDGHSLGGVYSLHAGDMGTIWAARAQGITAISKDFSLEHFSYEKRDNHAFPLRSLVADDSGGIWVTSKFRGIYHKGADEPSYHRPLLQANMGITHHAVDVYLGISEDRKKLYIGHENQGLFEYDINSERHRQFPETGAAVNQTLINLQAVGSDNYRLFYGQKSVIEVNVETGEQEVMALPVANVSCMLEDHHGYIWLAQRKGALYRWQPLSGYLHRFRQVEGLPDAGLTGYDCLKANGMLYFPSYAGLLMVDPAEPFVGQADVSTHITSLRDANGQQRLPAVFGDTANADLVFNHDASPLVFEFLSTALANPADNRYRYRMLGLSEDWIEVSADERLVRFQHLPPNRYRFEVQGSNADGIWGSRAAAIDFSVRPPLWQTWWAQLLYISMAITGLLALYHYRIQNMRSRSRQLESVVRQRTEELAREKQTVENLLAQKNEEFANISHEFRTPLTLILGPVKHLLSQPIDEPLRQRLEVIKRNGFRLLRLVDQLLHMERFKVARVATAAAPTAIKPTLSLIAQSFLLLAEEKNIRFRVESLEDAWITLTPDTLEKVVLNLLSNAIKYTGEGGEIRFSARLVESNTLLIAVSDTGIGIAPEKQDAVFNRFQRVHEESNETITGAGIGLALVKELVEAHQGSIDLDSAPGQGTTFTVRLPGASPAKPADYRETLNAEMLELELEGLRNHPGTIQAIQATSLDDSQPLVLVVEDNSDMRGYIMATLSGRGYQCLAAADGGQGLALATEHVPDLVISDVMMPLMDGFELSAALRKQEATSHIPIVLLTARGDRASRLRGWSEDADEYLTKPFDEEELCARVGNLLSIRDLLRRRFNQDLLQPGSGRDGTPVTASSADFPSSTSPAPTTAKHAERRPQAHDTPGTEPGSHDPVPDDQEWAPNESRFIQRLDAVLETRFEEPELRVVSLAKDLAMSERQLHRKMKSLLNASPNEYIRVYRLKRAARMLADGSSPSEVAYSTGFSSHAYFTKCFRAFYGQPPSEYARSATA